MKKSKKPPAKKWLLCWDGEKPKNFSEKDIPYFFAFVDEYGTWWTAAGPSSYQECNEPKNWMEIKFNENS